MLASHIPDSEPLILNSVRGREKKMDKLYASQRRHNTLIERKFYHGTENGTLAKINGKGFDCSYCGKNVTWFGQGSYFASDMSYLAQALYSPPDIMGH